MSGIETKSIKQRLETNFKTKKKNCAQVFLSTLSHASRHCLSEHLKKYL